MQPPLIKKQIFMLRKIITSRKMTSLISKNLHYFFYGRPQIELFRKSVAAKTLKSITPASYTTHQYRPTTLLASQTNSQRWHREPS
jgi:hypothetical protein